MYSKKLSQIKKLQQSIKELDKRLDSDKYSDKELLKIIKDRKSKKEEIVKLQTNTTNSWNGIPTKKNKTLSKNNLPAIMQRIAKEEIVKLQTNTNPWNGIPTKKNKTLSKNNLPAIMKRIAKEKEVEADKSRKVTSAIKNTFKDISFEDDFGYTSRGKLQNADHILRKRIRRELKKQLNSNKNDSFNSSLSIKFIMRLKEQSEDGFNKVRNKYNDKEFYFRSSVAQKILSSEQIKQWTQMQVETFDRHVDDLTEGQSGMVFKGINKLTIHFGKTRTRFAGSYIETPEPLKNKFALHNIKNDDDECIKWCLCSHKFYDSVKSKDKNQTIYFKKYIDEIIEPEGQVYPINIQSDIPKFEKLNDVKINVFEYPNGDYTKLPIIVYNTMKRNDNVCNLLLLTNGVTEHFVVIRNLSRLLKKPHSKDNKKYYCTQCLTASFSSQEHLAEHQELCFKHEAVQTRYPSKDKKMYKFGNYGNMFKHPFCAFMDFESTLLPVDIKSENDNTVKYQQHRPNSCGIKYNCIHDNHSKKLKLFNNESEEDLMKNVIEYLEELALHSYELLMLYKSEKKVSKQDISKHKKIKKCNDCNCDLSKENKVLHHDHITGEYISTLCSTCNLRYQYKRFLPVYVHNLKSYDSHFLILAMSKYGYVAEGDIDNISCIPNNEEKYITFSKSIPVNTYTDKKGKEKNIMFEIKFVDSLAFMADSLENLAKNLKSGCKTIEQQREVFKNTSKHFKNDNQFSMMTEKGVYPYDYITSYETLHEKQLPPKEEFYSRLNDEHCSDEDYNHAKNVYKTFKCKSLLDYHNIYLASDVLLLADIWESFREVCYNMYKLDPCYYLTAPGLSWDAMMYHTQLDFNKRFNKDFELELLTDPNMYLFVESGIRGGLSQVSKRYAKANNKYMSDYDKQKMDEYILYLDANNLYGYSMLQHLPMKNFKWNKHNWTKEDILELEDKDEIGFLFEVDLSYPANLHDLHNGYALASEHIAVANDLLNEWQQEDRMDAKIKKLCTSFREKKNYVINYRLLKLFLKLGLLLTKVNRVLQYEQCDFMASYIMKNTNARTIAKNDFEKNFYKLMNNSVFGKTMENVRQRINFKLVSTEEQALGIRNRSRSHTIFHESLVGVHLLKKEVVLNKPIYIGQCILDDSKFLMYDFHYNFMMKQFDRKDIDLLFTDTDSLCYHIKNKDPYEVIKNNKHLFDLSDDKGDMFDPTNKKVIGKFKNESPVKQITEFVGLRSKVYAYKTDDVKEHKKCKGVKKSVCKKELTVEMYKDTLFNRLSKEIKQNTFRSHKHVLYTEEITKIALSSFDDKCYVKNNNIDTYTFNHFEIM